MSKRGSSRRGSRSLGKVRCYSVFTTPAGVKAHYLAHQTFADTDMLDTAIHHAVDALNVERTPLPLVKLRISA
jgi:hypothetical protein